MDRQTVSVPEAAKILGVSASCVFGAVRRNELPALRIGKRIVIPRAALERMLALPISPQIDNHVA